MATLDKEQLSNLSFVLKKPLEVCFEERPKPSIQDEHDVLVAITHTGICGSDVHYWQHGAIGDFVLREPMVLGHESAGVVIEAGAASGFTAGDRVAIEPGRSCRRCADCRGGRYNLCANMVFAATPPHDGTLTGVWCAPAECLTQLPAQVSLAEGALAEPLAVAVHAVRLAGDAVRVGRSLVVLGAGPVGLLCAAVGRVFGADRVVVVDVNQARLEFAREFAHAVTYTARAEVGAEEAAAQIKQLLGDTTQGREGAGDTLRQAGAGDTLGREGAAETRGQEGAGDTRGQEGATDTLAQGADTVIDASGAQASMHTGMHVVRRGGTYVQVGSGRADAGIPVTPLCLKEVTARGSFRYSAGDFALAVRMIASGRVDVKRLVSDTVPFARAQEAFERVKRGEAIKMLITGPNPHVG